MSDDLPPATDGRLTANVLDGTVGASVQADRITGDITINAAPQNPPPPHQLPPVPAAWVDREHDLRHLRQLAATPHSDPGTRVVGLFGPHGIGKSALGSRTLHDLHEQYPGGQIHVDVRGHDPEGPRSAADVLGQLLRTVRSGPLPAAPQELAAWWRSVTAGRNPLCMLVDHVIDAETVRLLLPGGSGHLVLVTSRDPLAPLAGDGADLYELGPLPPDAAHAYLIRCVGDARLRAEPAPTQRLVALAAGVPLALGLSVAQLAAHPSRPIATVVRSLTGPESPRSTDDSHRPPSHLSGATVTTHLDTAYAGLPPDAARAYRLLALLPVHDVDASVTAAVCTAAADDATASLHALARAHLLEMRTAQPVRGTVLCWPTAEVREHARHQAGDEDAGEVLRRALGWALAATSTADALITPSHSLPSPDTHYRPEQPVPLTDKHDAMSWLKAQAPSILALIRATRPAGAEQPYCWALTYSLWPWWRSDRRYAEWIEMHRLALDAVQRSDEPEPHIERRILNSLGLALRDSGSLDEAIGSFTRVLNMARQADDWHMTAQALHELGSAHHQAQRPHEAVPHLQKAREMRAAMGYRRGVALTDIVLGQIDFDAHNYEQAISRFAAARDPLLDVDDTHDAARALAWRGRTTTFLGDILTAEAALRAAHAEFVEAKAPMWTAHTLEWLGEAAQEEGRTQDALALYVQALDLYVPQSSSDADRLRNRIRALA